MTAFIVALIMMTLPAVLLAGWPDNPDDHDELF